MKQTYSRAVNTFLQNWRERPDYRGALLTGSFATETADGGSDIDLRILYADDADVHEVGECQLGEQVISFVGTTKKGFLQLFADDLQTVSKFEIRRFAVGKVLEDSNQELAKLRERALEIFQQPLQGFDEMSLLVAKLKLSRNYKVLLEMPTSDPFFGMAYFDLLQQIFQFYSKSLQVDVPAFIKKKSRYFTNENYRKAHLFEAFPDVNFVHLYLTAVTDIDTSILKEIYQYVLRKTGNFPTTDFMARFSDDYQSVGLFTFD